jgi:excinuclease UvrABC helicase subunit UvrB
MMHTRAVGTPLVEEGKHDKALAAVDSGIDAIQDFLDEYNQGHRADECVELVNLEQWRKEIVARQRKEAKSHGDTEVDLLREKLDAAVANEEFEEAARLRDEIRRIAEK